MLNLNIYIFNIFSTYLSFYLNMQLCTIYEDCILPHENIVIRENNILKDFNIVYLPNKHPDIDEEFNKFKFENLIEKKDLNNLIENLISIKYVKIENYKKISLEYHMWNVNVIYYNILKCITINDIRKYCRTIDNNYYFTAMNWSSIKHIFDILNNANDKIIYIEDKININDEMSLKYIKDIKNKFHIRIRILKNTIDENEIKIVDKIDKYEKKINNKIDKLYFYFNILSITVLGYFIYYISNLDFCIKK